MSYEYARIPIKPGLNIICGPNGSGKSSILLAISVALGQTYTERSRRLGDLVRWGKDIGRVTLVFENSKKDGRRQIERYDADALRISRVLRRDGTYWFEVNFQTVPKSEITSILSEQGIDPDNMLLIMHQNMMHQFGIITASEKLKMMEEAVGFGQYRGEVIEAQEKLMRLLSEEESVSALLENAQETLEYWKSEYDRYLRKQEFGKRKRELEQEYAWANVIRLERILASSMEKKDASSEQLRRTKIEAEALEKTIEDSVAELRDLRYDQGRLYSSLIEKERRVERHSTSNEETRKRLERISEMKKCLDDLLEKYPPPPRGTTSIQIAQGISDIIADLDREAHQLKSQLDEPEDESFDAEIATTRSALEEIDRKYDENSNSYIESKVKLAVLRYQEQSLDAEVDQIERQLRQIGKEMDELRANAESLSRRVDTERNPVEVSDELKTVNAYLASIGDVSEDVEAMYKQYSAQYEELKVRVAVLADNRKGTLEEVEKRKEVWRDLIADLLDEVTPVYQELLSKMDATGSIRLVEAEDIEDAGLELTVGFKGAKPAVLNNMTQSGGEQSVSIMAFLIALQQHVISSFRAVDEFDVHMDPRNREVVSRILLDEIKGREAAQYLTITPGQIDDVDETVHVITVQNVKGRSEVRLLA